MSVYIIYFLIIVLANTVGAISGMGGGVIIKPVMDAFAFHPLAAITFYSCVAVFTMSIASTYKQLKNGFKIEWPKAIAISIGSVFGGVLGNKLFTSLLTYFGDQKQVQLLQIVLTVLSLILVLVYTLKSIKTYKLTHLVAYFAIGLFLGGFSTLLGIGGGPINVSLLIFCFSLTMKEATIYSIVTIFFSQLAKLVETGTTTGYSIFDLSLLVAIIPAAIIGGYLGGYFSGKVSEEKVSKIFIAVVVLVIVINVVNGVMLIV